MTRHEPRGHSASLSPTQTESDITARPARSNSQPGTTTGGRYGQDRRHPTGGLPNHEAVRHFAGEFADNGRSPTAQEIRA